MKSSPQNVPQNTSEQQSARDTRSKNHKLHADYFEHVLKILVIAIAFVKFALRNKEILSKLDVEKLEVVPPHHFDYNINKDSYADMIYRIPLKEDASCFADVFVVLEHKSYKDPLVLFQLMYYCVQVLFHEVKEPKEQPVKAKRSKSKVKLPVTIPIIVYNGKGKFSGPRQLKELFPQLGKDDDYLLNYKPIIIDLNEITEKDIPLDANDIRPYVVIKALKLLCDGFPPREAADCINKLLPYTYNNEEYRAFTITTLKYFMSVLNDSTSWLERIIKENQEYERQQHIDNIQGGTDMLLSIKDQYIQQGYERGDKHGFERGDKHGFERGIGQGIEQEMERNLVSSRKTLITVLQNRFKSIPLLIQKKIELIHNNMFLQMLIVNAATCQSMDDFCEKLS